MLRHLNHLFEGNFNLEQFEHLAFYNQTEHQIEMHLKSLRSQTVELKKLNLAIEFTQGETIHTEISRKFELEKIQAELEDLGLVSIKNWTDENQWFGLILCQLQTV